MNNWEYFNGKYGDPIGKGAQCQVYRKGDTVYKVLSVGHDMVTAMHEGYALAIAESEGIPVSNIHGVYTESGHIVMEMDYVSGETLTDLMIKAAIAGDGKAIDAYLDKFVELQIQLHSRTVTGLGDVRKSYLGFVRSFAGVPEKTRQALLSLINELPDGQALCHNDYHPRNVILDSGKYVIIDWDSAMTGDPAGDAAHSYLVCVLMDGPLKDVYAGFSERYLEKYLSLSGLDKKRIEAWLPLHAAILYVTLKTSDPQSAAIIAPFLKPLI